MRRTATDLSADEARRIALAAQGLDRPRPRRVTRAQLARTVRRLGVLQLDFVSVLVPAHYQVPLSRLGAYDRAWLDELAYDRRVFVEQWAHQASLVPVECWSLLRAALDTADRRIRALQRFLGRRPGYVTGVERVVRARGPLTADQLAPPADARGGKKDRWGWTIQKVALEALFVRGVLAVRRRGPNQARVFDLAERVIPSRYHQSPVPRADARRTLLHRAARALGVATVGDLADYYQMPVRAARPLVADLAAAGAVQAVRIEGWRQPAYLDPGARLPSRSDAAALLSPFDPLIWTRDRVARLFDFQYRVELFVPAAKRQWGYYVLPFLQGDRLVARVDLKVDRPGHRLCVLSAHAEREARAPAVARALASELRIWADWLALDTVTISRRGSLARSLAGEVRALRGGR